MQKIGSLLMQTYQERVARVILDDQTVFYVFKKIVSLEYGTRGEQYIEARYYKNKKLFVAAKNSLWMSELQMSRDHFAELINKELGVEAVTEIKVESSFAS
jgi:predicted nucleic acid-binding Zn ribbon protein